MTTTRTTTKADNEYMHEVSFGFFYTTKKKNNPQQRLCSIRDNDKRREKTRLQQKTVRLRENV